MEQLPALPCIAKIVPANNALIEKVGARGDVDSIDWSAAGGAQQQVELYAVELTYPKILKANVTTLETFFDTNVTLPVATQALGDGREYMGYLMSEPVVTPLNAIRFTVTIKLLAWRGLVPGMVAHFNEDGITGATPVTEWVNQVAGGSAYDFDVVEGTAANMLKSTMNGLDCLLFDGTVNLATTAGQTIASPTVFIVVQHDQATGQTEYHFDALADLNARAVTQRNNAGGSKFAYYQGVSAISITDSFDLEPHVIGVQFRGDTTTNFEVSGVGSKTGSDAGPDDWEFATLGALATTANRFEGKFCEMVVYADDPLTAAEFNQNINALKRKWMTR